MMRQGRTAAIGMWARVIGIVLMAGAMLAMASGTGEAATTRCGPTPPGAVGGLRQETTLPVPCGGGRVEVVAPTPVPFPTGAATAPAMNGTRAFVSAAASFAVRYPEAWNVGTQGGSTTSFSPETGETRIAGFLIEVVPNPQKTPEDDLRDVLREAGPPRFVTVAEPYPVTVDGVPAFRADVRITTSDTSSRRGTFAPAITYVGSLLTFERDGVNYRVGVFGREGDAETLARAEEVLASLRFT